MNQAPDPNDHRQISFKTTRERLEEVRRKREQRSTGYQIRNAPNTIMTNMIIQILSTVILAVGFYYIFRYLELRREYMEPQHFTIFVVTMMLVGVVWLVYTIIRLRADYGRYHKAVRRQEEIERKRRENRD